MACVLGTGPSMSQELADFVRGKCVVIAVNDCYRLAPWADALVAHDHNWWSVHKDALDFAGRKFCGYFVGGTERLYSGGIYIGGTNSGLQGMRVAYEKFSATLILLLGFDMHGTHFFGKHPAPLNNTHPVRRKAHLQQFERWEGCKVINCTPGSSLTCFPYMDISEALEQQVVC